MKNYLNLCKKILRHGIEGKTRTGIPAISLIGEKLRFSLRGNNFPILTTKKINFPAVVAELIWFIKGKTNIRFLLENDTNIWNEWAYERYKKITSSKNETMGEFKKKILKNKEFASKFGDLGPIYGKQWRDFDGIDQLTNAIQELKDNPASRRIIISSWNVKEIPKMILPPCHILIQFNILNKQLYTTVYQRSADIFLGVPFNISSYALLSKLVARELTIKTNSLTIFFGNVHLYKNHLEQIKTQIKRKPFSLPKIVIDSNRDIFAITKESIKLKGYSFHPWIKGEVAV